MYNGIVFLLYRKDLRHMLHHGPAREIPVSHTETNAVWFHLLRGLEQSNPQMENRVGVPEAGMGVGSGQSVSLGRKALPLHPQPPLSPAGQSLAEPQPRKAQTLWSSHRHCLGVPWPYAPPPPFLLPTSRLPFLSPGLSLPPHPLPSSPFLLFSTHRHFHDSLSNWEKRRDQSTLCTPPSASVQYLLAVSPTTFDSGIMRLGGNAIHFSHPHSPGQSTSPKDAPFFCTICFFYLPCSLARGPPDLLTLENFQHRQRDSSLPSQRCRQTRKLRGGSHFLRGREAGVMVPLGIGESWPWEESSRVGQAGGWVSYANMLPNSARASLGSIPIPANHRGKRNVGQ